ncbi:Nitronate monooxygenase domain-containing protein [Trichoderma ceciliae]
MAVSISWFHCPFVRYFISLVRFLGGRASVSCSAVNFQWFRYSIVHCLPIPSFDQQPLHTCDSGYTCTLAAHTLSLCPRSKHRFVQVQISLLRIREQMTMAPTGPITTPITTLLGIQHPVILAGMARTAGGRLAAAVSNAGGLGVIGGFNYTPDQLRDIIAEMKRDFKSPDLPFGVDLALPQVGGNARKTNHDYTGGKLDELIDITIESGARLFVSAVGVPPKYVIEKLHKHGILVMNMVGHPKHAVKALDLGVDIVCAQGGEGGGHTGDIANSVLVPAVVDVARKYRPPMLKGSTALVVAAGGIRNGRSLASSLMQGAVAVWVGTRFVASEEAECSEEAKKAVVACGFEETERTLVISGRPLRVRMNEYIQSWHDRPGEIKALCDKGIVPMDHDLDEGRELNIPYLMGQVAGAIEKIQPAGEIVAEMVQEAVEMLQLGETYLTAKSRL